MPAFPTVRLGAIGDGLVQTVNARELHTFLIVGRDFTNWIKGRIAKYGFAHGIDFTVVEGVSAQTGENLGGRPATDYFLTLDMAKELSMVENNPQGRQARRYFIDCERRLHAASHPVRPEIGTAESLSAKLRKVAECRKAFGLQAAREMWFALGLTVVPAMRTASDQGQMQFGLGNAQVGGHA